MTVPIKQFAIGPLQFSRGCRHGFLLTERGELCLEQEAETHIFISRRFDSAQADSEWGRLVLLLDLPPEDNLQVLAFAADREIQQTQQGEINLADYLADQRISGVQKRSLFRRLGGVSIKNAADLLLYSLRGRYLWFLLEITGSKPLIIRGGRLIATRQSFIGAFPEIYRTDHDFLERYLSIFSSLYLDLQQQIDQVDRLIDLDTASNALLAVFADWMGIKTEGGFLLPDRLRQLLREGYDLACVKGTREALRRVVAICLGQDPVIVEQSAVAAVSGGRCGAVERRLYGEDALLVTVMVRCEPSEQLHSQLLFLLSQFKPARSRINLVFLAARSRLDSHCYMDYNACMMQRRAVPLDSKGMLNSGVVLL